MKTDSQLQRDVQAELEWEPRVDHARIGVAVKDGVVALSGFVSSYAQKIAAEEAARRVKDVHAIAEEVQVRFIGDPKTSDAEIAKRILDVFAWDVIILNDLIDVKVEKGRVTLSGTVDWNFQRDAAKKAAGKITGVKGISDLITLRKVASSTDVRERIMAAFKRNALLDAASVNVEADGSTVRLGGKVHSFHERQIAERAAWAAPGVTRVEDNLLVA